MLLRLVAVASVSKQYIDSVSGARAQIIDRQLFGDFVSLEPGSKSVPGILVVYSLRRYIRQCESRPLVRFAAATFPSGSVGRSQTSTSSARLANWWCAVVPGDLAVASLPCAFLYHYLQGLDVFGLRPLSSASSLDCSASAPCCLRFNMALLLFRNAFQISAIYFCTVISCHWSQSWPPACR